MSDLLISPFELARSVSKAMDVVNGETQSHASNTVNHKATLKILSVV